MLCPPSVTVGPRETKHIFWKEKKISINKMVHKVEEIMNRQLYLYDRILSLGLTHWKNNNW